MHASCRPTVRSILRMTGFAAALALAAACGSTPAADSSDTTPVTGKLEAVYDAAGHPEGLHNYFHWSEKIGTGSQPDGEVAFKNLAALGYTTILTVDGSAPDVETAAKYGLRYIHIPIGYDGMHGKQYEIARALEVSEGPVYVHCHHGKHRGPTAAMVGRIVLDGISNEEAVAEMKEAGCSPRYDGLYKEIANFVKPTEAQLDALPTSFPSRVKPKGLTDSMVAVSNTWENMLLVKDAAWSVPPSNPDVSPRHEATILWEHFKEIARTDEAKLHGEKFLGLLSASENDADALQQALEKNDTDGAAKAFEAVKKSCDACHKVYRD